MYFNPLCLMNYGLFINRRSDFKLIMISLDTKWFQLKATVRKKNHYQDHHAVQQILFKHEPVSGESFSIPAKYFVSAV